MRLAFAAVLLLTTNLLASDPPRSASCISLDQAATHLGKETCISGKVTRVSFTQYGNGYIDLCQKWPCPFVAIVHKSDMKDVGNISDLRDRVVEIRGKIVKKKNQLQIVVRRRSQLGGEAVISPLPAEFQAERNKPTNLGQYPRADKRGRAW